MYWEESGKISKLKNNFLYESQFLQPFMILITFLQPENLYTVGAVPPKQQIIGHYRVEVRIV